MTTTPPALGPLVAVYALVGHDECLLVVRDPDATTYRLPGGLVRAGEAVEDALRRILREQVDARAAHLDFCAVVELREQHAGTQPTVFELALLFDVTLTDPSAVRVDHGEARWATTPNSATWTCGRRRSRIGCAPVDRPANGRGGAPGPDRTSTACSSGAMPAKKQPRRNHVVGT
ncbi:NUDIX domain-containing protein [Lentzea alba]|uniref:NUDIX domain-containing protein n=1 Tax=Lentzea alba TaxID=2714351 RepID=UPI0039BF623D